MRVVPVLVDGVELPAEAELPADIAQLRRCQYLHLRHRSDRQDIARLVNGLIEADRELAAMTWIAESVGPQNGRLWHRLHATDNVSRCLESSGAGPPALRPCDGLWLQQWYFG